MDRKSFIKLGPGVNLIKLFTAVIYKCLQLAREVVHGKPFQSCLLFAGKPRSLPYSNAIQRFFNRVSSCFTNRHQTWLERLALDKHSSLLRKFVNYGRKKFYNIGPWCQSYKKIYGCNLRLFTISQSVCSCQAFQGFVFKARSLHQIVAPERSFTRIRSSLTQKHLTKLVRLAQV